MIPRPVRAERWQFAQESQRRYQQRKAHTIRGAEERIATTALRHSVWVREWLRAREPAFAPRVIVELGSGAHGLVWAWPDPVQRIAVDPLAQFYRERFAFLQSGTRDILQATGEGVPLRDGSVDLVLSDNVLDHVQDPVAFLRQAARILAPAGLFYLTTHFSHRAWNVAARCYNALHAAGAKLWVPAFPSHPYSFRRTQVLTMLRAAGLRTVHIEDVLPSLRQRRAMARRWRDFPKVLVYKDATMRILARKA